MCCLSGIRLFIHSKEVLKEVARRCRLRGIELCVSERRKKDATRSTSEAGRSDDGSF
jgi:hypothetical protein